MPFALFALALALAAAAPRAHDVDPPPARALALELCRQPRLAGTPVSAFAIEYVTRVLEEAGWQVEHDRREVLLSLPRRIHFAAFESARAETPLVSRIDRFDPDATPPGDLPLFNAWTASGEVRGQVVDAGYGTRADFERLKAARIDLAGKVALCRYGRGYRGVKVELAQEYGCAAVLLFSPSDADGAERGPVWPAGPWKPAHEAQRGAIGPMALGPGDPSTPGWPSLPAGETGTRLEGEELDARLPRILCTPIGAAEAAPLLAGLATRRVTDADGERRSAKVGPGPVEVSLAIDAPRELREIVNVIARLPGTGDDFVIAGNHRDAWVRGARDAGSGTVTLLRAAQHLGERHRAGWRPANGVVLGFWDAEESGLIGSTEWGEAHADELRAHAIAYLNGDAVVGGLNLSASGTPGLGPLLERVVALVSERVGESTNGAEGDSDGGRRLNDLRLSPNGGSGVLSLPGSGSDFTVFLHHLSLPVLDLSLSGVGSGEYHTTFDDFPLMDRFVDPDWLGHETAGLLFAELLAELASTGRASFDDERAARELARHAREAAFAIGEELAAELAAAFDGLAGAIAQSDSTAADGTPPPARFYQALEHADGLEGRPWFKNQLWAPGLELGYGSELFPRLQAAPDDASRRAAADELLARIAAARAAWERP